MASSSTSSGQKRFAYEVFLSFRGEDTRKNFVGHLYDALERQGIYTYKDDEKIEKGKEIKDDLMKSIEHSKLFIIVFSKNYASSSWCLDELAKIMECHKTTGQKAYPVFYDVEPTEVRKQTGSVGEAFAKHKNKVAAGKQMKGVCTCLPFLQGNSTHEHKEEVAVEKWREALVDAANLAGWELKNTDDGHEAKVIQTIVEEISQELRPFNYSVDEKLVGMENQIKDVESILDIDCDEVRLIGIRGMGGIGKTTLAWAIFAKICTKFEGKSFVENVREVSNSSLSGLKSLQKQVLSDVLKDSDITVSSVPDGKSMMKMRLHGKKVLIVLDDVDHIEQLEALAGERSWFKPGSRIIITTRDEQVLRAHQVNLIHGVNLLSDEKAYRLFSRYAFGKEIPNEGYEELSRQVVHYAAGLPLTLRVLGSFLCSKNKLEWKDALERLKTIPLEETLKKLELSYNSLENDYKEIFLDVACFLKGEQKDEAIKILDCCGFRAIIGLRVLEQKSLITIRTDDWDDEYLSMHDHLEEMGKNIVRREHPDEPNKHSRLWILEEIENVLANNSVNEATRCIKADDKLTLSCQKFMKGLGSMKKLRVLILDFRLEIESFNDWKFDEVSQNFPNALRYLRWDWYPFHSLLKTLQMDNLVGLEMRHSKIEHLWEWEAGKRKVLYNLKYLDLAYSNLKTFDLQLTPNLCELRLQRCYNLLELQMPIGCPKLTSMELGYSKLKTLDLVLTPKLKRLTLTNCDNLEEFDMHINGCRGLTDLKVTGSKLKTLDLTWTPNLKRLYLANCDELVELHTHSYGYQGLSDLQITGSKLKTIDLTLTPNLRRLYLNECDEMVELHMHNNGCLELRDLIVTGSKLKTLDLGLTPKLEKLTLRECSKLKTLDLGLTPKLEKLTLRECHDLVEVKTPDDCLKELSYLDLSGCSLFKFFSLRKQVKSREFFLTVDCQHIFPLESGLQTFKLSCVFEEHLFLSTGDLKKFISLSLCPCTSFNNFSENICGLPHLRELIIVSGIPEAPKDLDQLECLEKLYSLSTEIKLLPDSICMFKLLKSLKIESHSHMHLEKLPEDIGQLEYLEMLHLVSIRIRHLPDSICMLKHLKSLILEWCEILEKLPDDIGQLECLEELHVIMSTRINHLPDSICLLKHLKSLQLEYCWTLEKLPEYLCQLECLEMLHLVSTSIKHLPENFCMLKHLKSLILEWCENLEKLPEDIGELECLEKLHVMCARIKHLPDSICMLKHLESIQLEHCWILEKLPEDLGHLDCLQELILRECSLLRHVPNSICKMKCLNRFYLLNCISVKKLPEEVGHLKSLKLLDIRGTGIRHLPQGIFSLEGLSILGDTWLSEMTGYTFSSVQRFSDYLTSFNM